MEDTNIKISWCRHCRTPIVTNEPRATCPLCKTVTKYMCKDVRPVFPEERLLIEILLNKPFAFADCSVWASSRGRYYVDGESLSISQELFCYKNTRPAKAKIDEYAPQNNYTHFNADIDRFVEANKRRFAYIKHEAMEFIMDTARNFPRERLIVSFSGGKDSTACADLVSKALGSSGLTFIFGDTTLELATTYEYISRFRQMYPYAIFKTARNNEKDFFDVCRDIGAPSAKSRWCCTMFKTGPISTVLNRMFGNENVIAFTGIRANESPLRSKYERFEHKNESLKIQQQSTAKPIFYWNEADVWLYILTEKLDFNDAYRLGNKRVGCWVCPNSTLREVFLGQVHFPKQTDAWRNQLIEFAESLGKSNCEDYVDELCWTRRHGGEGVKASADVKVESIACTTDEYAKVYTLKSQVDNTFYSLFTPFGTVSPELGRKLIGEVLVLDPKTKLPIISIQQFHSSKSEPTIKIKILNTKNPSLLQSKIVYQIRKFNACRKCGKCAGICAYGAISLKAGYEIDDSKCTRCKKCVTAKYMEGGCMMFRVLKTRKGAAI